MHIIYNFDAKFSVILSFDVVVFREIYTTICVHCILPITALNIEKQTYKPTKFTKTFSYKTPSCMQVYCFPAQPFTESPCLNTRPVK